MHGAPFVGARALKTLVSRSDHVDRSESPSFPDISDLLALRARGRQERARLSFGEKIAIVERMRERLADLGRLREAVQANQQRNERPE
jgi:hypothetical protein